MAKAFLGVRATANIPSSPTDDGRTPSTTEDPAVIDSRTAQMQAILDNDRVLHLKDGVYVVGQLVIPDNGGIIGASRSGTILWAKNALNDTMIISVNQPAFSDMPEGTHYKYTAGVPFGCMLQDLTVDGNNENQTIPGAGVWFYCLSGLISNIDVTHIYGNGVVLEKGGDVGGDVEGEGIPVGGWNARDILTPSMFINSRITHCYEGKGLYQKRGSDSIIDCVDIATCHYEGLHVGVKSNAVKINSHVWSCGHNGYTPSYHAGVLIDGHGCHITYIQGDAGYGNDIVIVGSDNVVDRLEVLNKRATSTIGVRITGSDVIVSNLTGICNEGGTGVSITGNNVQLRGVNLDGLGDGATTLVATSGDGTLVEGVLRGGYYGVNIGSDGVYKSGSDIRVKCYNITVGTKSFLEKGNDVQIKHESDMTTALLVTESPSALDNDFTSKLIDPTPVE